MNNKNKSLSSVTQFIKYALVGAINTIIDIAILNTLSYATGITHGKILFIFNIIAFSVYSTCGYYLNKKFTFKDGRKDTSYFEYASVLLFGMILNSFMLVILTSKNPLIHILHNGGHRVNINNLNHLWFNICIVIDSMTIGFMGFLINKFFVFNEKKTR
ncbi:GtrA family protein [Clostridium lacusfryxellense]|uniref:GtrA family protein n=1 Tax=Clostridium lacusfryxellense TaxID=205328 RepID=UPI001C0D86D7|nr:GtrA family protein [Clostridium lacusfryxellense]MBU3112641.1 GtrA family protein [Clostridium lacusfryxellense]